MEFSRALCEPLASYIDSRALRNFNCELDNTDQRDKRFKMAANRDSDESILLHILAVPPCVSSLQSSRN